MRRRLLIAGVLAVVIGAGIWLAVAWAAHRGRSDYSGTVETREIQIGSKVGGRVIQVPVEEGQTVKAGTTLVREWRAHSHTVLVREDGFEYAGQRYRSLTVIAERITGTHWSGPRFFWPDQANRRFARRRRRTMRSSGRHGPRLKERVRCAIYTRKSSEEGLE